jgi:hypothetical protein
MVITETTKANTNFFLNMLCNNVTSGKLAPAELIINAMTGAMAIPFRNQHMGNRNHRSFNHFSIFYMVLPLESST